jgi:hypothetical protein
MALTVEGRPYSSKNGRPLDVPMEDARTLAANGWVLVGASGPLEARPAEPKTREAFVESATDRLLLFDGRAWRDALTGAVVE